MTNPIDPARLEAVLKAIDPYKMAPPGTKLYVYGVPIVRKVLEADDQWRSNHQVILDSSHPDADVVSQTEITPAANPTSGGNVKQGGGEGREPELNGTRFDGHHYILSNGDEIAEYTPASILREIADHVEYRQRQRDKPEVTEEMVKAALRAYYNLDRDYPGHPSLMDMKSAIAAALAAQSKGKQ